jgi:hypothetical protein
MPTFEKNKGFNLKNKGNFDFGNKGNFDFHKGEGSIGDAVTPEDRKPPKKKSAVKNYKKGYYGA